MTSEQRVINSVLKNKNVGTLFEQNVSEMFVNYGDTWQFIRDYFNSHNIVPSFSLVQEKFPDLPDLPIDDHDSPAHYMDELRADFLRSELNKVIMGASSSLGKVDPKDIIERLGSRLYEMTEKSGTAIKDLDVGDFDSALEDFNKKREEFENDTQKGVHMGISFWDSALPNGMMPGNMITLAGYSGKMKSFLSALMAVRAYEQGKNVFIVSLEMAADEYRDRLYTIMGKGRFSNRDMSIGFIDHSEFDVFAKENDRTNSLIVAAGVNQQVTPAWIASKIKQYGSDFVIVDYAQLCTDNAYSGSPIEGLKNFSREIKQLAMASDSTIVVISSVTADSAANTDNPPRLQQMAYSKALIYDSDLGIIAHRHTNSDRLEVICEKNRRGSQFAGILSWDIDSGVISESFDLPDQDF